MKEKHIKFCLTFVGISILIMALVSAFNFLIDPYDMWGGGKIVGFNVYSPQAESMERMCKPVEFIHMDASPEVVFIGTSQFLYALDTEVYKDLSNREAYNFSFQGAGIYEQRRILEHVIANDDALKEVYVGVFFADFVDREYYPLPKAQKSFAECEDQYGKSYVVPQSYIRSLLSFDALVGSCRKIIKNYQERYNNPVYTKSGKMHDEYVWNFYKQRQFDYSSRAMGRSGDYRGIKLNSERVDELRYIADLCKANGITCHILIAPVHARQMEFVSANWDVYEDWKRTIVKIAPVLDFGGYNEITMSPAKRGLVDENTNPYFWDVVHMKTNVGNMIIEKLLGMRGNSSDFGVLLTPENVESHLIDLRHKRELWEETHPESLEEVRYISGFSNVLPRDLRTHERMGKSLISVEKAGRETPIDPITWSFHTATFKKGKPVNVVLTRFDQLHIEGICQSTINGKGSMYAVMENKDGVCYYSSVEYVDGKIVPEYMHERVSDGDVFILRTPMWDVPEAEYRLYFIEVSTEGVVYQSDYIGTVTVITEGMPSINDGVKR